MDKTGVIERVFKHFFRILGLQVGRHPWQFISLTVIVCFVLSCGILRRNFEIRFIDLMKQYDSKHLAEQDFIESQFHLNYSFQFDMSRAARLDRFGRVLILAKDGGSILRNSIFTEILRLDEFVQNISVSWNGEHYTYKDICAKNGDACFRNEILELAPRMELFEKGFFKFRYPISYESQTLTIKTYSLFLGGVETDERGFVEISKGVSLWYILNFEDRSIDKILNKWENEFVKALSHYRSDHLDLYFITSDSTIKEVNSIILSLTPFVTASVILSIIFAVLANVMADWVLSKPWLGIFALITAMQGTGAGFGISQMTGYPIFSIHIVIVLMMVGIGLDDTFVMVAAWRSTSSDKSVELRLAETYEKCGMAITITSLTNTLSFCIGVFTPFPITVIFSVYSAFTIAACYLCTLTFFGGCLALCGRAEAKNLHALTFWHHVTPKSLSHQKGCLYRLFCTGGKNIEDPDNPLDNREHAIMRIFRDYYANKLFTGSGIAITALAYVVYASTAIWGTRSFGPGLEEQMFLGKSSYAYRYFDLQYKYFMDYQVRFQIVINEKLDYSDTTVQDHIESLFRALEEDPQIAMSIYTESWLRQYLNFLNSLSFFTLWKVSPECKRSENFLPCLSGVFLKLPGFQRFQNDIAFSENKTEIVSSRFYILAKNIPNPESGLLLFERMRQIFASTPIRTLTPFHYLLILAEHVFNLSSVTYSSIGIAVGIMALVSISFVPRLDFFLTIAFAIVSVEVGLMGFIALHGIKLNTVNVVYFIVSVGFSVDNSTHLMCAYKESEKKAPQHKFQDALYRIGLPILQGAISTFIIVIPLLFFSSRIYRESAIFICYVLLLSLIHSICFIPFFAYLLITFYNYVMSKFKIPTQNNVLEPLKSAVNEMSSENQQTFQIRTFCNK